jgi:hypothetical protein
VLLTYWPSVCPIHPRAYKVPKWLEAVQLPGESEWLDWELSKDVQESLLLPGTMDDGVYDHVWRSGDVMVYDNRRMMHSATDSAGLPLRVGTHELHHVSFQGIGEARSYAKEFQGLDPTDAHIETRDGKVVATSMTAHGPRL